jgi:NADH:ubiquinone oxidoreductase subunit 2 (subunit N)
VSEFFGFLFVNLRILLLENIILITSIGLKGNLSFIPLHQWVINPY